MIAFLDFIALMILISLVTYGVHCLLMIPKLLRELEETKNLIKKNKVIWR